MGEAAISELQSLAGGEQDGPTAASKRLLRQELLDAFQEQRAPQLDLGDVERWVNVIDRLIIEGAFEPARHALVGLGEREPDLEWARNMLGLLELLPGDGGAPFGDEDDKDVQIAPCDGADAVVFAFCGVQHRLGLPLWLFQGWMSRLGVSVVYLRDFQANHYLSGIRSLGAGRTASQAQLARIAEDLGARKRFCLGNSSGGFGALLYGLELEADGVLGFGAAINMEPEFNTHLNRRDAAIRLRDTFPDARLDLRAVYEATAARPATVLVYGEHCWDDRLHSEHMAGAPGVSLAPVAGYRGHGTITELMRRGEFAALMADFVGAPR